MQALGKFDRTAVAGSERIEEDFETLKARLDLQQPFVFHIGLDVREPHSWRSSYKDIKVRSGGANWPCLLLMLWRPYDTSILP